MSTPPLHGDELAPSFGAMPTLDRVRLSALAPPFDPEGALAALDEPICVVSTAWTLLYMNQAFAELAIQGGEVVLTKDLREIFPSLAEARLRFDDARARRAPPMAHPGVRETAARPRPVRHALAREPFSCMSATSATPAHSSGRSPTAMKRTPRCARSRTHSRAKRTSIHSCASFANRRRRSATRAARPSFVFDSEHGHIVSATGSLQRMRNTRFALSGSLTARAHRGAAHCARR